MEENTHYHKAVFAGGCFWCLEAVFQLLKGVQSVRPGFTGGHIKHPAYREVCTGRTGHAEAVEVVYDPQQIPYIVLLDVFFSSHDPTTLNRQGNDVGTQYRSEIFYQDEDQKECAESRIHELDVEGVFSDPIVTQLTPAGIFFEAEPQHHNYYRKNGDQPYCQVVIRPKVAQLRARYESWLAF